MTIMESNGCQILLVDDDMQFLSFMNEMLTLQHYDVMLADNGESGLARYESKKPDLIITDIVMPGKEGIEMIMEIRNSDSDIPIVAISGGNLGNADSYLGMAKKLGATAVFEKPFSMPDMLSVLKKLLPA